MCLLEYSIISVDYKIGEDGHPIYPTDTKGLFRKPWWQDSQGYQAALALVDDAKQGLPCALWMVARMQEQEIYDFHKKIDSQGAKLMLAEAVRSKFPPAILRSVYTEYYPWFFRNPEKRLPPESERQLIWNLEKAAEAGSIDALYELGSLRRLGKVEGNANQVIDLMKAAAAKGSPDALFVLALAYWEANAAELAAVYVLLARYCSTFYANIFDRPIQWDRIESLYESCQETLGAKVFARASALAMDIATAGFDFQSLIDRYVTDSDAFYSYKVFHQGKTRIEPDVLP